MNYKRVNVSPVILPLHPLTCSGITSYRRCYNGAAGESVGRLVVTGHSDGISLIREESHFCLTDPLRWRVFTQCDEESRLPLQAVGNDGNGRFSFWASIVGRKSCLADG